MKESNRTFGNVLIIGLGMIGGSVAKALKVNGLATLFGYDRQESELTLGISTGVIDHAVELTADVISKMDIIILATPVRAMESILSEISPFIPSTTLVTDVGSTKLSVIDAISQVIGFIPDNYILGHPIAGAEKSGVLAANPNLFRNHKIIVTPLVTSSPTLLNKLNELWASIGGDVVSMDVDKHDHVLACSSHLPHLLAYTLVDTLANNDKRQDVFKFAAGGFRDFTRIASSDPTMWRDVFLANKEATLTALDDFTEHLSKMREAIEIGDGATMFGVFTRAKSARDHFLRLLEAKGGEKESVLNPCVISVEKIKPLAGSISLIGDKFLSHRAISFACLAVGVSQLNNLDISVSVKVTIQAFRDMGVVIEENGPHTVTVHGVGLYGLKAPIAPIDIGHSLLTLYILLPILAAQKFSATITSDSSLSSLPLDNLIELVEGMGVTIDSNQAQCLPLHLEPNSDKALVRDIIDLKNNSSKLRLSAVLSALYARNKVTIQFAQEGRDHTENLLKAFNCNISIQNKHVIVESLQTPTANSLTLAADVSKTAWVILLATLIPKSHVTICNAMNNKNRNQFIHILQKSGARIFIEAEKATTPELTQILQISSSEINHFHLTSDQTYTLRDELIFLCVAAVYAQEVSLIEGIQLLPFQCENRLKRFIDILQSLGVSCSIQRDSIEIHPSIPMGGRIDCAGDFTMALALIALGSRSLNPIHVVDSQIVLEEFEDFEQVMSEFGSQCQIKQTFLNEEVLC